jgi:ERCC4-type nuclease
MLIKIDYRENKLLELCQRHAAEGIQIKSENLPLGDIIICNDEGQEKAIIERKSLADLAASIRDGRYNEQSFRLNQCEMPNHQIYYLIEGELRFYKPFVGMPDKKTLLSAMVSISYFKGFSLFRTTNLEESTEWLLQFAVKLQKEGPSARPYYMHTTNVVDSSDLVSASLASAGLASAGLASADLASAGLAPGYASVVAKRVKKNNISPENIGEIMLSQIPSVSNAAALAIMQKFGSMAKLITALSENTRCLDDITTANKTGQLKKISKPCINNIYQFLLRTAETTITI